MISNQYEFHARAEDFPFTLIGIFINRGSYGDAELMVLFENKALSIYFTKNGIDQASKIGEQMLDNGFMKRLLKRMDDVEKAIDDFKFRLHKNELMNEWRKYVHLVFRYSEIYRFCEEPFLREIENILSANYKIEVINSVIENEKLIGQFDFNDDEKNAINILKLIGDKKIMFHLKNEKIFSEFQLFIEYVVDKFKIRMDDIYYFDKREIDIILRGRKVNIDLIRRRINGCAIMVKPQKAYKIITGKKFEKLRNLVEPKNKIIKGISANGGIARGKVRRHLSWIKIIDFDKGDIIVTGMTNPQIFPYLKKAAAIVTDEGGITCHAAIISRELNIPCIIGTKIATQILKDGDKIEVDANKGVVKKIK